MNLKRSELFFLAILVPVDVMMIFLAFLTAYYLRAEQGFLPASFMIPPKEFLIWAAIIIPCWIIIFAASGLYSFKKVIAESLAQEILSVAVAVTAGMTLITTFLVLTRTLFFSRLIIIYLWILAASLVVLGRYLVRYLRQQLFQKKIGIHRVILVGQGKPAEEIAQKITLLSGFKLVGILGRKKKTIKTKFYANIDALRKIKKDFCDDIILADSKLPQEKVLELIDFCYEHHLNFKFAPELYDLSTKRVEQSALGEIPLLELKKTPLDGWGRIIKRGTDLVGSIFGIIIFSPVMLVITLAIKLDSAGSVFFTYKRVGRGGRLFIFRKFRSMYHGLHRLRFNEKFRKKYGDLRIGSPMIKIRNDPRVTRVGRFIRRTHLDELAQLFSVLTGTMSLVGPRPHEPEEVKKYQKHHRKVLMIKPGMTGPAQISGASDLDFEEEVRLDTEYIQNWSLAKDILIILKTPIVFLRPPKAE